MPPFYGIEPGNSRLGREETSCFLDVRVWNFSGGEFVRGKRDLCAVSRVCARKREFVRGKIDLCAETDPVCARRWIFVFSVIFLLSKNTQVEENEPPHPTHKFKRAEADVFRSAKNSRAL